MNTFKKYIIKIIYLKHKLDIWSPLYMYIFLNLTHSFSLFSCSPGYFGRDCVDACLLNPCEHTSSCVRKPSTKRGYSCECGHNYYGQYCEHK